MNDYGRRRIVVDSGFEAVVGELSRAINEEGLQMIARVDVRDRFWRDLARDFRRYLLIEAWSPELALDALSHDVEVETILPTTFVIYELADGETAIVAGDPLAPVAAVPGWRRNAPRLAAIADQESGRVARVLARLKHRSSHQGSVSPAA